MREDQSTKHFFGGTFQNNRKMHLKVARSTKTVKNFRQAEKPTLKPKKLQRERLVLSQPPIRALARTYSQDRL